MKDEKSATPTGSGASTQPDGDKFHSALFAQMVMQQANLALMLLGRVPHPETGQTTRDLDAAKLFIDQLEMLEIKTKGNLNAQESALLKQSLMTLRLAYVDAVNAPPAAASATPPAPGAPSDAPTPEKDESAPAGATGQSGEEDSKKRFSKKY